VKHAAAGIALLTLLLTGVARAGDCQREAAGYVFDNQRLLTHQMIWGIVHGVRLLGLECQNRGQTAAADAYLDWLDKQLPRVRSAETDLARHYFGRDKAQPEAIDAAVGLKPRLETAPELIGPACASLPEALRQERYDLEKYYLQRREAIRKGDPDFPGAVWLEMDQELASGDCPVLAEPEPAPAAPPPAAHYRR
jgi:hypothetical protein